MGRSRFDALVSVFVTVHPHETSALLHSFFCFFFVSFSLLNASDFENVLLPIIYLFIQLINYFRYVLFCVADFECVFRSSTVAG